MRYASGTTPFYQELYLMNRLDLLSGNMDDQIDTLFLFLGGFSQYVALRQRLARYSHIVPSHHRCPTHLALMFYNQLPAAWRVSVS